MCSCVCEPIVCALERKGRGEVVLMTGCVASEGGHRMYNIRDDCLRTHVLGAVLRQFSECVSACACVCVSSRTSCCALRHTITHSSVVARALPAASSCHTHPHTHTEATPNSLCCSVIGACGME